MTEMNDQIEEIDRIEELETANEKFLFEIHEIYGKKIPWIVRWIGLCTITGTIFLIANFFLIASSLGITNVFVFAFSTPAIILLSILLGILLNTNERKPSPCIIWATATMIVLQITMIGTFIPLCANILTTILSIALPSAICILILAPAIQRTSRREYMYQELSKSTIMFLFLTFSLIHCVGAFSISKLYNFRQIEIATMLVEKFEITQKEDHIEILLPPEYAKYNNYLKSTFSFGWTLDSLSGETLENLWSEKSISCREGKKKWHIAIISFPEHNKDELLLHFKHPWEDYEARTKSFSFRDP